MGGIEGGFSVTLYVDVAFIRLDDEFPRSETTLDQIHMPG